MLVIRSSESVVTLIIIYDLVSCKNYFYKFCVYCCSKFLLPQELSSLPLRNSDVRPFHVNADRITAGQNGATY